MADDYDDDDQDQDFGDDDPDFGEGADEEEEEPVYESEEEEESEDFADEDQEEVDEDFADEDQEEVDEDFADDPEAEPLFEVAGHIAECASSCAAYLGVESQHVEEDTGHWGLEHYAEAASVFFGGNPFFGEGSLGRFVAEGFQLFGGNDDLCSKIERLLPAVSTATFDFFEKGGSIIPQGFVTLAGLEMLRRSFPNYDFSFLHVTLPERPGGQSYEPLELPPELQRIDPADTVDLRKLASPVADQGQTSRCSAFAWTHALELAANICKEPFPRLSVNFSMMQFQRLMGDFKNYQYAYKGGEGTEAGPRPGETLLRVGTCRQDYWPDHEPTPREREEQMLADAARHRLQGACVSPVHIDDLRRVLTAGHPVHLAMTTGPNFSEIGRDGLVKASEGPSGQHGWHAMLLVGYLGNYYIVKNSWGTDWGDQGYCYIPKRILVESQAEFTALFLNKTMTPAERPQAITTLPSSSPPKPVAAAKPKATGFFGKLVHFVEEVVEEVLHPHDHHCPHCGGAVGGHPANGRCPHCGGKI